MSSSTASQTEAFSIGVLSERTQVNTVTLRAWERRYGLLKPQRTAKGHRLYTQSDIDTVEQVLALIKRGVPLRKIKPLLQVGEAEQMVPFEHWEADRCALEAALASAELDTLGRAVAKVFAEYPASACAQHLLTPVFKSLAVDSLARYLLESALLHYAVARLSQPKASAVQLVLIGGEQASKWHLALLAIALGDSGWKVHLLNVEAGLAQVAELAAVREDAKVVYYRDGLWKSSQIDAVTQVLTEYPNITLCGTAPALASLVDGKRAFADIWSCVAVFSEGAR
ncbi:MAG: MerR family transcriptional regulator [Pseudomonadales bacterium]